MQTIPSSYNDVQWSMGMNRSVLDVHRSRSCVSDASTNDRKGGPIEEENETLCFN